MAIKTKAQLATESASTFVDNSTGLITPSLHRTYNTDTIDSFLSVKDASELQAVMLENRANSIASGSTVDLSGANGNLVHVTGTSTITSFGSVQAGARFVIVFDGILLLTYNATSLILPTAANITTAVGDTAFMISEGSDNWRCVAYQRADGTALVGGGGGSGTWGSITGTLSAQTDLQEALDEKVNANTAITGGSNKMKISYDEKGLVLSGSSATLDDLSGVTILTPTNNQVLTYNDSTSLWENKTPSGGSGTVTSVALTMPSAFSVANSPVTTSGSLDVTAIGTASQYIRGDGVLANFPTSSGGGSSLNYYLNGSVDQGTLGGVAFKEMNSIPFIGAGTDFTINANGYIQSFITDVNVPNQIAIPAGNWNFEMYFSASSGGGSPSFYIELYKLSGGTLTLIASNSTTPEGITNGTAIDLYTTAVAVPSTVLLTTDRLAIRVFVNHSSKTIKLHTEDNHLCQVITTFSTGLNALNGLTEQVQYFAIGDNSIDFDWYIDSTGDTHLFNIPSASTLTRGLLTRADWDTFDNKYDNPTGTISQYIRGDGTLASLPAVVQAAASDETTALTTGVGKVTFRMPYAMTLTGIRASLTTAQASSSLLTVDVNQNGTSILSTKLTFDNTEKTTVTAATQPVISTSALTDDAEITIDIDQIGASGAAGLKITLIGTRV
jgi:hypothetical protein